MPTVSVRFTSLVLAGLPAAAIAASFDCNKATSRVEKLICADAGLSKSDEELATAYREARRIGMPESEIRRHREWLNTRDACEDVACVKASYKEGLLDLLDFAEKAPPDYMLVCDSEHQLLTIEEARYSASADRAPRGAGKSEASVTRIRPNALVKIGGTRDRPLVLPGKKSQFECRLGNSVFRVLVEPLIFNADPQGQCGAAPPAIWATVLRNSEKLVSELAFRDCPQSQLEVHRVEFDERAQSLAVRAAPQGSMFPARVEKRFAFSSVPKDPIGAALQ